jgi:hypothetical protein
MSSSELKIREANRDGPLRFMMDAIRGMCTTSTPIPRMAMFRPMFRPFTFCPIIVFTGELEPTALRHIYIHVHIILIPLQILLLHQALDPLLDNWDLRYEMAFDSLNNGRLKLLI